MKKYILFDEDATGVRLDMPIEDVPQFDFMWRRGHSTEEIAYKLGRSLVEIELLAQDRFLRGKIKERPGQMNGTKPWKNPYNNKIRVEA